MSTQQPELRRSGRGETDQEGRRHGREAKGTKTSKGRTGPIPEANRAGHHPEREQDKPAR